MAILSVNKTQHVSRTEKKLQTSAPHLECPITIVEQLLCGN